MRQPGYLRSNFSTDFTFLVSAVRCGLTIERDRPIAQSLTISRVCIEVAIHGSVTVDCRMRREALTTFASCVRRSACRRVLAGFLVGSKPIRMVSKYTSMIIRVGLFQTVTT